MKSLDLNTVAKLYLNITLNNENHTTLMLKAPKKKTMSRFYSLASAVDSAKESEEADNGELDEIYALIAEILSCNKAGIQFTVAELEEILDMQDIFLIYDAYGEFLDEITNQKN